MGHSPPGVETERAGVRLVQTRFGRIRWKWEVWRRQEITTSAFGATSERWVVVNSGRCLTREDAVVCAARATFVSVEQVLDPIAQPRREAIDA